MIAGISASLSGLSAFGNMLSNTADNVANVNTDGYKSTKATITEDPVGLPQVTLTTSDSPGATITEGGQTRETSNVDLAWELPQMIIAQSGYEANIKALSAQSHILKTTIDMMV